MATIHTIIQSKSVGKTLVSMMLAHYLRDERGQSVLCLDTDTVNDSLSSFAALQAVKVAIPALADHCRVIPQETAHVVFDTSASDFLPFCSGLCDSFLPALSQTGHSLHLLRKARSNRSISVPFIPWCGCGTTVGFFRKTCNEC